MIVKSNQNIKSELIEKDGQFVVSHFHDIDPLLEANYYARNDQQEGWSEDRSIRRVASVPFLVWLEWSKNYPEILVGDKELREKTLRKLLYKDESKPFWTIERGL